VHESTLIFCHTRRECEFLTHSLRIRNSTYYHSKLSKKEKVSVIDRFITGEIKTIFATSSLELGVDLPVRNVIHWTFPETFSQFTQRNGRVGRDGGVANVFVLDGKNQLDKINQYKQDKESITKSYLQIMGFLRTNYISRESN
jgi:superfamily II DNA helicase RecQ